MNSELLLAIYRIRKQPELYETLSQKKKNSQNKVEQIKIQLHKKKDKTQTHSDVFQVENVQYLDIETNVKGRKEQSFDCSSRTLHLQMKRMCL